MNCILESCQIKYNKDSTQDLVEMLILKEGKHGEMPEVNQMTRTELKIFGRFYRVMDTK